ERRFAAARRTNERSDRARRNAQGYIMQHLVIAVGEIEMVDRDRAAQSRDDRRSRDRRRGFRHFQFGHHERRLRLRSRNRTEVSAINITRKRKTNASPYWT